MQTTWLERGTVSGRVALLLRSAEIQPLFIDLSDWIHQSNPPSNSSNGCPRLQGGLPARGSAGGKGDAVCFRGTASGSTRALLLCSLFRITVQTNFRLDAIQSRPLSFCVQLQGGKPGEPLGQGLEAAPMALLLVSFSRFLLFRATTKTYYRWVVLE